MRDSADGVVSSAAIWAFAGLTTPAAPFSRVPPPLRGGESPAVIDRRYSELH